MLSQDDRKRLRAELVPMMRNHFGGLDFWRLTKKWKDIHYTTFANFIILLVEEELCRITHEQQEKP